MYPDPYCITIVDPDPDVHQTRADPKHCLLGTDVWSVKALDAMCFCLRCRMILPSWPGTPVSAPTGHSPYPPSGRGTPTMSIRRYLTARGRI